MVKRQFRHDGKDGGGWHVGCFVHGVCVGIRGGSSDHGVMEGGDVGGHGNVQ